MVSKTIKFIDKEKFIVNSSNNQILITVPRKKLGNRGLPDKIKITGFWSK